MTLPYLPSKVRAKSMGKILFAEQNGIYVLKFVGDVRLTLGPTISTFLDKLRNRENFRAMIIDMSETKAIDSTALGLVAKVGICCREQFAHTVSIISPNDDITRVLKSMAMQDVCMISSDPLTEASDLAELPREVASEDALREQVLDAHRTLMSLNKDNQDKFKDLVEALEMEKLETPSRLAS